MRYVSLLALAATLTGCAQNQAQLDPGPFPANYKEVITGYLNASLKDPYSVMGLTISRPTQITFNNGALGGGMKGAWTSCVAYNAKNAFGGYVGMTQYTFYLKGDGILTDIAGTLRINEGC